ncbi:MAG: tetratricopeptide repeat protein, partial [Bacteroidota bacterium]
MKFRYLFFLLFCMISKMSMSQEKPEIINAKDKIQKGLEFYEAEKYDEALKEFQKIPENDTAFYSAAVEQILTFYRLKRYEEGIAIGKKALALNLYLSPELYTNMGCCYDNLEKYGEAVKLYDEGIKNFPKTNLLYFNKAYSLSKLERNKEAFECYKKSVELNPFHPGTHYSLGVIAMNEGKTALAMLAFNTYILLDPNAPMANNALACLNEMSSTKYLESTKPKGTDITDGDDYSDIDMLIQNYVALDKKYKVKSKLKLPFVRQAYLLFDKIPENSENAGFWHKTYVPFYKQLLKDNKFDIFANYLLIASANEYHKKLVEKNRTKLIAFVDWIKNSWDDQHRDYNLFFNGKMQKVNVFRANQRYAISSIGTLGEARTSYIGYAELYHANSKIKGIGKYTSDGKRDGEWLWYNENGLLKSKETYVNGVLTVYESFSFIGIIESHVPFLNEKIDGDGITYNDKGAKDKLIGFKVGVREGAYEEYYSNGQVYFKGTNKKGNLDGAGKTYYSSGELKSEVSYLEGEKNSLETNYYRNGKIMQKATYVKGKLQGDYISYFDNGKTSDSLKYSNNKPIGKNITFFKTGVISVMSDFDESGKLNGIRKEFDSDGKIYNELEYKKGEIIGYKYFNKKGDVIKQDKKKSGNFDFEGYYSNGTKRSTGKYGKEEKQGDWKFYDVNGNLESTSSYKDGEAQGELKNYYTNGKTSKIVNYKDDLAEGYYCEYFKNGNVSSHGNYKNDEQEGNWIGFYPDKTLEVENYYIEGLANGTQKYYAANGKIVEAKTYYKGVLLNSIDYDTLGNVIDSTVYTNASGKRISHFYKGGPVKYELNLQYNNYQNEYISYFPNGKTHIKGQYFNGQKNGDWTWYSWAKSFFEVPRIKKQNFIY